MRVEGRIQLSLGRAVVYYTLVGAEVILIARVVHIVWPYRRMLKSLAWEGLRCFEVGLWGR